MPRNLLTWAPLLSPLIGGDVLEGFDREFVEDLGRRALVVEARDQLLAGVH